MKTKRSSNLVNGTILKVKVVLNRYFVTTNKMQVFQREWREITAKTMRILKLMHREIMGITEKAEVEAEKQKASSKVRFV